MARRGDEFDAAALDVVMRVVQRVDLEFAAVARSRVDHADAQRAPQHFQDIGLQSLAQMGVVAGRRHGIAQHPGTEYLLYDIEHYRLLTGA